MTQTDGTVLYIDNPTKLPKVKRLKNGRAFVKASIISPYSFVGVLWKCLRKKSFCPHKYINESRVMLIYDLPLSEIIYDFFDQLNRTKIYAS